jgi:alpha-N-arabinofuranosidase
MANLAQTINVLQSVILTDKEKLILTPTYYVMEMYNVHQDATMIPVKVKTDNYVLDNKTLPAVSVSASKDKNGLTHISLVNIDQNKSNNITVNINGASFKNVTGRVLASAHLQDYNTFDNPEKIKPAAFTGATLKGNTLTVKMPPASIVVLELK